MNDALSTQLEALRGKIALSDAELAQLDTLRGKTPSSDETLTDEELAHLEAERREKALLTRDRNFNPMTYISEGLSEPNFKQRLASSAVWAFDNAVVDAAISLYFDIKRDNPNLKEVGELIDAFRGTYSDEGYWGEGNARLLVKLLSFQETWHETAYRLATITGWLNYAPKSLQELIVSNKFKEAGGQEMANLQALAEYTARNVNRPVAEIKEMLLKQRDARELARVEQRHALAPAVGVFVATARDIVIRQRLEDAFAFSELPTGVKLRICTYTMGTTGKGGIDGACEGLMKRLNSMAFNLMLQDSIFARETFTRIIDKLSREFEQERAFD